MFLMLAAETQCQVVPHQIGVRLVSWETSASGVSRFRCEYEKETSNRGGSTKIGKQFGKFVTQH